MTTMTTEGPADARLTPPRGVEHVFDEAQPACGDTRSVTAAAIAIAGARRCPTA
ncbi:MAG: hypothetical protein HY332_07695 [Chloroflexi bacterium]|nr:hypothetical protein [Chloroflexota bacterium]